MVQPLVKLEVALLPVRYSKTNAKDLGIQLSFANLLLSRGCNVLFADLSLRPEAKATISKYSSGSPRAVFQKTDVVQWPELERMFVVAEREFGKGVDLVVPGAGIYEPVRPRVSPTFTLSLAGMLFITRDEMIWKRG